MLYDGPNRHSFLAALSTCKSINSYVRQK